MMSIVMRSSLFLASALLIAIPAFVTLHHVSAANLEKVRQAGVAGSFYPSDPKALTAMMDEMLAGVTLPHLDGTILGVVAPHAGYPYSGPVAAYTFAALKGHKYARVVV